MTNNSHPHEGASVFAAGTPLEEAKAVAVMVHGRGANAPSILQLGGDLGMDGFAYIAPEAVGNTWYPLPFMRPTQENEPYFSSALRTVDDVVSHVIETGIPAEKIIVIGFSQGACLGLEYVARNPQRYGGAVAFSGGLISLSNPNGEATYEGSLEGTPVFIGCSDIDSHIPLSRVNQSTAVMRRLGAEVEERIYPGMGHMVNEDEMNYVRGMMRNLLD